MDKLPMSVLVDRTGVAPRTVREYIRLGLLPRPEGVGPAALYSREHLQRLWAIQQMQGEGMLLVDIQARMETMTARELSRVKPPEEPAPPPPVVPAEPPVERAEPVALSVPEADALPGGSRWLLASLLPGMVLMVRDDAPAIVRRAAAEIIERYSVAER